MSPTWDLLNKTGKNVTRDAEQSVSPAKNARTTL